MTMAMMASCKYAIVLLFLLRATCSYPATTFSASNLAARGGRSLPGSVLRLTHWPWYASLTPRRPVSLISAPASPWGAFSRPLSSAPLRATPPVWELPPPRATPVWALPPLVTPVHERRPNNDFVVISLAPSSSHVASRRPTRYDWVPASAAPTPSPEAAAAALTPTPQWVRLVTGGTPLYDMVETVQSGARPNLVIRRPATSRIPMTSGRPNTITTTSPSWPSSPFPAAVGVVPLRGDQPAGAEEAATGAAAGPAAGAPPDRNTEGGPLRDVTTTTLAPETSTVLDPIARPAAAAATLSPWSDVTATTNEPKTSTEPELTVRPLGAATLAPLTDFWTTASTDSTSTRDEAATTQYSTIVPTSPTTSEVVSTASEQLGDTSTFAPYVETTTAVPHVTDYTVTSTAKTSLTTVFVHPAADNIVFDSVESSVAPDYLTHAVTQTTTQQSSAHAHVTSTDSVTNAETPSDLVTHGVTTIQPASDNSENSDISTTTGYLFHKETVTVTEAIEATNPVSEYETIVTTDSSGYQSTTPVYEDTVAVTNEPVVTTAQPVYEGTTVVTNEPVVTTAQPVNEDITAVTSEQPLITGPPAPEDADVTSTTHAHLTPFVTADPTAATTEILDTIEIEINRRGKPDVTESTTAEPTTEAFSPLAVEAMDTTIPPSQETTTAEAVPYAVTTDANSDASFTLSTTSATSEVSWIFTTEALSTTSASTEAFSTTSAPSTDVFPTTPAELYSTYSAVGFTTATEEVPSTTSSTEVHSDPIEVTTPTTLPSQDYTTAGPYTAPVEQTTHTVEALTTSTGHETTWTEAFTATDFPASLTAETATPAALTSAQPYNLEGASTVADYTTASPSDLSTLSSEVYTVASAETFWTTFSTQPGPEETISTVFTEGPSTPLTEGSTGLDYISPPLGGDAYTATVIVTESPTVTEELVSTTPVSTDSTAAYSPQAATVVTNPQVVPKETVPTSAPVQDFNYYDGVAFEDGTSLGGSPADGYIPDYDTRSDEYDGDYFADAARPRLPLLPPASSDTKGLEIASLVRETPAPPKQETQRRGDMPLEDDDEDDEESNDVGFGSSYQATVRLTTTPKPVVNTPRYGGDTFEGQMLRRMAPLVVRQLHMGHLSDEDVTRLKYIFGPIWPEVEELARAVGASGPARARRDTARYPHFKKWRGEHREGGLARRSTTASSKRPARRPARQPTRRRRTKKHSKRGHKHANKAHPAKQDANKTHPPKQDTNKTHPPNQDDKTNPAKKHVRKPKQHKHHVKPEAAERPKRSIGALAAEVDADLDEEYDYEEDKDYMGDEDYDEAEDEEEGDGEDLGADAGDEYEEEYEDDGDVAPPRILDDDNPSVMELHYRARQAQGYVPEEKTSPVNKDLAEAQAESVEEDMAMDVAEYEYY
ncbi:mucin-5AC-like [Frankliniella occidentalis]|uniref:Mucin-5AC-like n=1 Tax=Frankliniella occidentalis TaxID=133901 RepID=A0A6J1S702_FRAOC|nr:mucin-5AC-like [Frankliniella occidentalis]